MVIHTWNFKGRYGKGHPLKSLYVALFICLLIGSCSDSTSFSGKSPSVPNVKDPEPVVTPIPVSSDVSTAIIPVESGVDVSTSIPPEKPQSGVETFSLSATTGLLDVVWVVDNSGSMGQEIEQVNANLDRFIGALRDISQVQLSVLSADCERITNGNSTSISCTGLPVTLSDEAKANGHVQQNIEVKSNNALAIFGHSLCDENDPSQLCKEAKDNAENTIGSIVFPGNNDFPPAGFMKKRFRPNSTKVVVIVTDDNAKKFTSREITDLVKEKNLGPITYFAFQGLKESAQTSDCDIANEGTEYENLTQASGGESFDICPTDWSSNFSKLTSNIRNIIESSFMVERDVLEIISVSVDGVAISKDLYQLTDARTIEVNRTALAGGKSVTVVYEGKP